MNVPLIPTADLARWLTAEGDERIAPGPDGLNRYGLPALPEPGVPSYGSCTASVISPSAFSHVARTLDRLRSMDHSAFYAEELEPIRAGLRAYALHTQAEVLFADSGTTLHLLVADMMRQTGPAPLSIVMMEAAETGRGVPAALQGHHFSNGTPRGGAIVAGQSLNACPDIPVHAIAIRRADGHPRSTGEIDAEVQALVETLVASGRRVLLNTVDVSKTGLITPSLACTLSLKQTFGEALDILVDACQFRLAPETLRACLDRDWLIALTGSKFMGGPPFSGALMIPASCASRLRGYRPSGAIGLYSAQAEWPQDWRTFLDLPGDANIGLLLRWQAALFEMQAFQALPAQAVEQFFTRFAVIVHDRLAAINAFEPLPVLALDRDALTQEKRWDAVQTIFPFLIRRQKGPGYFNRIQTKRLYDLAGAGQDGFRPFRLGQPVECGERENQPVSALRLCAGARLAVDALSPSGRGIDTVLAETGTVLDELARLAIEMEAGEV